MDGNTLFLVLSLFFPRIALFFFWVTGSLPYNKTPFLADLICSILCPRILILIYIYQNYGFSGWFWVHYVAMIIAFVWNYVKINELKNKYNI